MRKAGHLCCRISVVLLSGLLFVACEGTVTQSGQAANETDDPGENKPGSGTGGTGGAGTTGDPRNFPPPAAPPALRRLTHAEFLGALAKLTGVSTDDYLNTLGQDPVVNHFDNQVAALQAGFEVVEGYHRVVSQVVARALSSPAGHARMFPNCSPLARSCVTDAIAHVGRRVFRRPLTSEESAIVQAVAFDTEGRLLVDAAVSILESLFLSPQFLYRLELGEPDPDKPGYNRLTNYEIATAISLTLWRETPDDSLLDIAAEGGLSDRAVLGDRVRSMLADSKANVAVESFATQWLRFSTIPNVAIDSRVVGFDEALRTSAIEEARRLVQRAFLSGTDGANVLDLLTSPVMEIDDRLATVYGYAHEGGNGFRQVRADADDDRQGLFGTVGFFLATSKVDRPSIVGQGLYVRDVILCDPSTPPPADVVARIDSDPQANSSEYRLTTPVCAGCHRRLDLIGKGLSAYNVFGARVPGVDESAAGGTIEGYEDSGFSGPAALAREVEETGRLPHCLVENALTWLYGRGVSTADEGAVPPLLAAFETSEFQFQEVLAAYFSSDAFLYREVETP